jgi:hypothetical protein
MAFSSLFTSIIPLSKKTRTIMFYTICTPIRALVGAAFYLRAQSLFLNYVSFLWGTIWLALTLYSRRWIDRVETPPWWTGIYRFTWRFGIILAFTTGGLIGVLDTNRRADSNIVIAYIIWTDLVVGIIDYVIYI